MRHVEKPPRVLHKIALSTIKVDRGNLRAPARGVHAGVCGVAAAVLHMLRGRRGHLCKSPAQNLFPVTPATVALYRFHGNRVPYPFT